jgi:hypothetical protein
MTIPKRLKLQPVNKKLLDQMSALCDSIERELESGGENQRGRGPFVTVETVRVPF